MNKSSTRRADDTTKRNGTNCEHLCFCGMAFLSAARSLVSSMKDGNAEFKHSNITPTTAAEQRCQRLPARSRSQQIESADFKRRWSWHDAKNVTKEEERPVQS
jgi:hypothetical protein